MKKYTVPSLAFLIGLAVGALVDVDLPWEPMVTQASLSPDDAYLVELIELASFVDRNFELRLYDRKQGGSRTIFRSPDEGRPVGSERLIWSKDASKLLLLGRHFYVRPDAKLPDGLLLYLMYDVHSGELWCNASQQARYPPFSVEDIAAIDWEVEIRER